jgi:hypothetical protein
MASRMARGLSAQTIRAISYPLNGDPDETMTMAEKAVEILHRDDRPQGGFEGLREHRPVMEAKVLRRSS